MSLLFVPTMVAPPLPSSPQWHSKLRLVLCSAGSSQSRAESTPKRVSAEENPPRVAWTSPRTLDGEAAIQDTGLEDRMKAALLPSSVNALDSLPPSTATPARPAAMLPPCRAWQILCQRTGGRVCRATFYRWISTGKVYSIRLGYHIFIPAPALEHLIEQCLSGERF